MTPSILPVIIIGAGPVGLAAAAQCLVIITLAVLFPICAPGWQRVRALTANPAQRAAACSRRGLRPSVRSAVFRYEREQGLAQSRRTSP